MPASEFDIINRYFATHQPAADVSLGIGDDCAVIAPPPGKALAVTTDTLVAGIHFPPAAAAADIACKALAVNLSDLAAMGAEPRWITLSLTLPGGDEVWIEAFAAEFHAQLQRYRCSLIGGDTTHGPLSVTLQAIGVVDDRHLMRRDRAKPGDRIYVTGTLGDAAIGLQLLERAVPDREWFLARLNRPEPRIDFGRCAAQYCACAIDISDGLAADLGHILERSRVGARVRLRDVPLSRQARAYFEKAGTIDWPLVLAGGDDYELCLALSADAEPVLLQMAADLNVPLACVGEITRDMGLHLLQDDGTELNLSRAGYTHF